MESLLTRYDVISRRGKYDPDFKRNTVLLSMEPNRSVSEVAENLGVHKDLIYQWRKKYDQYGKTAFPGNGISILTPDQKKIKELEKKLKKTTMEQDILKKAEEVNM